MAIHYTITVLGLLIFLVSLLIHVIIWRLYHPKHQAIVLFGVFLLAPIVFIIFVFALSTFLHTQPQIIRILSVLTLGQMIQVYMLHIALSLAYIFSYPAAQARCPTFAILLVIKSAMPRGATRDEILSCFSQEEVMGPRVHDLVTETLVKNKQGWLELSRKGRILIKGFKIFRKLSALPMGRG